MERDQPLTKKRWVHEKQLWFVSSIVCAEYTQCELKTDSFMHFLHRNASLSNKRHSIVAISKFLLLRETIQKRINTK
jgi:hypothetical protein